MSPGLVPLQRFVTVDRAKIDIMFTDDVEFDVRQAAGALGLDPAVVVPLAKSWVEDGTAHGPFANAHFWVRALWAE